MEGGEAACPGGGGQRGGYSSLHGAPGNLEPMGSHWRAGLGALEWARLPGPVS